MSHLKATMAVGLARLILSIGRTLLSLDHRLNKVAKSLLSFASKELGIAPHMLVQKKSGRVQ